LPCLFAACCFCIFFPALSTGFCGMVLEAAGGVRA
jgi:hypothetical protein